MRRRDLAANVGRPWSDEDREWVVRHKDRLSAREMGLHLERPEHAIHTVLSKMGVAKRRVEHRQLKQVAKVQGKLRRWVDTQLFDVEVLAVRGNLRGVASRMGRSHLAVRLVLWRAGLPSGRLDGMLSLLEVSKSYGCTRQRVERLIRSGVLRAEKPGAYWRIDPADAEEVAPFLRARSKHAAKRRAG